LSTRINPIVAILTGLVTPEPGDFLVPVSRLGRMEHRAGPVGFMQEIQR
jgi:hypothetical protein